MVDAMEAGRKRTQEAKDSDPKRPRVQTGGGKVLHVRALPGYTTEQELVDLCKTYGSVVKVLLLQDKNQAFVEMSDAVGAADVLAGLEYSYPSIRNKRVYWQYSDRLEVEAKTAVYVRDNRVTGQTQGGLENAPTTILLSVTDVTIPVSLEAMHQIGSPYGDILRIITFNKENNFQALLEYSSPEEATQARTGLDGKDVYEGCCHIRANFSNKNTLTVKQNDHRSWDYTIGRASQPQFVAPVQVTGFPAPVAYGYSGFDGGQDPYDGFASQGQGVGQQFQGMGQGASQGYGGPQAQQQQQFHAPSQQFAPQQHQFSGQKQPCQQSQQFQPSQQHHQQSHQQQSGHSGHSQGSSRSQQQHY
jgi:hnRNP-L/PTB/hephaestus splicing factor